jgi:hypothetical protein
VYWKLAGSSEASSLPKADLTHVWPADTGVLSVFGTSFVLFTQSPSRQIAPLERMLGHMLGYTVQSAYGGGRLVCTPVLPSEARLP